MTGKTAKSGAVVASVDAFRKAAALRTAWVALPDGSKVLARELSVSERSLIRDTLRDQEAGDGRSYIVEVLARALITPDGASLFGSADEAREVLDGVGAETLQTMGERVLDLCGVPSDPKEATPTEG